MSLNKRKQLVIVFAMFLGSLAYSQIEIKNKIIDFSTLLPIESASIYIKNTTIGTVSNSDGKFVLLVPTEYEADTLVISSIGYKSFKTPVNEFDNSFEVYLEEDIAALDEIVLVAETRPKTGNDIVLRAIKKLPDNLPELPYLQSGFVRHKERNKREFKWLVESAITLYDSSFNSGAAQNLKINVDEVRKSYDLRNVDSLLIYTSYLKGKLKQKSLKAKNLKRDTIETASLVKAIKWNDTRVNGLENLFKGKLNLIRNSNVSKALFGQDVLSGHQFDLDTILVDDERKIYKIKISESTDFINLDTKGIYNNGYAAKGWIYIYWDTYAVKKIEYELVAASKIQKSRSKALFDTYVNHKLVISYMEFEGKMYPNYIYYETPKLVNAAGSKFTGKLTKEDIARNKRERYYYTVQEILFSEIILDPQRIQERLNNNWDPDLFSVKPYNSQFWSSYNTLLESEEDEKLIRDLTKRSTLFKQ